MLCAAVQVGVIEDQENRERLSKLLRFYSSKCEGDNLVGLEEYVGRMKEGQKGIYYMVRTTPCWPWAGRHTSSCWVVFCWSFHVGQTPVQRGAGAGAAS